MHPTYAYADFYCDMSSLVVVGFSESVGQLLAKGEQPKVITCAMLPSCNPKEVSVCALARSYKLNMCSDGPENVPTYLYQFTNRHTTTQLCASVRKSYSKRSSMSQVSSPPIEASIPSCNVPTWLTSPWTDPSTQACPWPDFPSCTPLG
jgi:hypothetical protein